MGLNERALIATTRDSLFRPATTLRLKLRTLSQRRPCESSMARAAANKQAFKLVHELQFLGQQGYREGSVAFVQ